MTKFRNQKTVILGLNGSGKTEFGKYLSKHEFKRPLWFVVNDDDIKTIPKNAIIIKSVDRENRTAELNYVVGLAIKLAKENKIDALVIDEADLFIDTNSDLTKYPNLNDVVILQRHHGLSLVFMSRRPANLPTKLYESSDNNIFFASPMSDNLLRKLNAIDNRLADMVRTLKKGDFKFVLHVQGETPVLKNPIPLVEKGNTLNKELKIGEN